MLKTAKLHMSSKHKFHFLQSSNNYDHQYQNGLSMINEWDYDMPNNSDPGKSIVY